MADAELVLTQGGAKTIEIRFVGANDLPEDFSGAGDATFVVRESIESTSAILDRRTRDGNLDVMKGTATLEATLTQMEADALKPGLFVGEVAIEFSGVWFHSERFRVRILKGMAPHT